MILTLHCPNIDEFDSALSRIAMLCLCTVQNSGEFFFILVSPLNMHLNVMQISENYTVQYFLFSIGMFT